MNSEGQSHWNDELRDIGLEFAEVPVLEGMAVVDMTVRDVEDHGQGGFILVAIKRADGTFIRNPDANETLLAGDRLLILGHQEELPQLIKQATKKAPSLTYRGVRG
jgi:voltage-gated potassium channel